MVWHIRNNLLPKQYELIETTQIVQTQLKYVKSYKLIFYTRLFRNTTTQLFVIYNWRDHQTLTITCYLEPFTDSPQHKNVDQGSNMNRSLIVQVYVELFQSKPTEIKSLKQLQLKVLFPVLLKRLRNAWFSIYGKSKYLYTSFHKNIAQLFTNLHLYFKGGMLYFLPYEAFSLRGKDKCLRLQVVYILNPTLSLET